ncbi:MarR family transcriptional regulator [Kitasatospora albolonga]|uniref:MarR family winged helix-turn-helix transcriptional regulator n=2 Tax=Kitasatospora albolonga TaxID=68173 RepID=UPI0031E50E38
MNQPPQAPDAIRTLPSWLLGRASARGHRLVGEALALAGLRMPQYAVLAAVAELAPVSQAELSRSTGIDPKDMVALVGELQEDGLVERAPDTRDRRKNVITLAPAGVRRLRRGDQLCREANDELTVALSSSEREQLAELLARLVRSGEL